MLIFLTGWTYPQLTVEFLLAQIGVYQSEDEVMDNLSGKNGWDDMGNTNYFVLLEIYIMGVGI